MTADLKQKEIRRILIFIKIKECYLPYLVAG